MISVKLGALMREGIHSCFGSGILKILKKKRFAYDITHPLVATFYFFEKPGSGSTQNKVPCVIPLNNYSEYKQNGSDIPFVHQQK
jgi:hypothetical protein